MTTKETIDVLCLGIESGRIPFERRYYRHNDLPGEFHKLTSHLFWSGDSCEYVWYRISITSGFIVQILCQNACMFLNNMKNEWYRQFVLGVQIGDAAPIHTKNNEEKSALYGRICDVIDGQLKEKRDQVNSLQCVRLCVDLAVAMMVMGIEYEMPSLNIIHPEMAVKRNLHSITTAISSGRISCKAIHWPLKSGDGRTSFGICGEAIVIAPGWISNSERLCICGSEWKFKKTTFNFLIGEMRRAAINQTKNQRLATEAASEESQWNLVAGSLDAELVMPIREGGD